MADAKGGAFRAVLVWKIDRWPRNLRHLIMSCDELRAYGVDFKYHQMVPHSPPTT
jgi:DNA invertase Pin-like site-specific DNA recombinase